MACMDPNKTVLLVEDDAYLIQVLSQVLKDAGYTVFEANGAKKALRLCDQIKPDIILTDYKMPGLNGLHLMDEVHALYPHIPVVLMTAFGTVEVADACVQKGAAEFLVKPFDYEELLSVMRRLTGSVEIALESDGNDSASELYPLVGNALQMRLIYKMVAFHVHDAKPLVILGERGVGKLQIAMNAHFQQHEESSVLCLDCSELQEVLSSEQKQANLYSFENLLANKQIKTFVLRGISDLSREYFFRIRHSITRLAQDMEAEQRQFILIVKTKTDSETNPLTEWLEELSWRKLFVPPLRDRGQDVAILLAHMLNRCAGLLSKPLSLSVDAYEDLLRYDWPGNLREMYNVLLEAAVYANSGIIDRDVLHVEVDERTALGRDERLINELKQIFQEHYGSAFNKWSEMWESFLLKHALAYVQGNKFKAAEMLGLHRTTLRNKMRNLNIK